MSKTLSDPRKKRQTNRSRRRERELAQFRTKQAKAERKRRRAANQEYFSTEKARLLKERAVSRILLPPKGRELRHVVRKQQVATRKGWRGLMGKVVQLFQRRTR